mgnify:CR=1 FL=1
MLSNNDKYQTEMALDDYESIVDLLESYGLGTAKSSLMRMAIRKGEELDVVLKVLRGECANWTYEEGEDKL